MIYVPTYEDIASMLWLELCTLETSGNQQCKLKERYKI